MRRKISKYLNILNIKYVKIHRYSSAVPLYKQSLFQTRFSLKKKVPVSKLCLGYISEFIVEPFSTVS